MSENNRNDDEIEIDLTRIVSILLCKKKVIVMIIASCTLLAMVVSFFTPPTYESKVLIRANKTNLAESNVVLSLLEGERSTSTNLLDYVEIMKSRAVIEPAMDQMKIVSPEMISNISVDEFVKRNLRIERVKDTNIIKIIGKGHTPEEAQLVSSIVAEKFMDYLSISKDDSYSYRVKLLDEMISTAQKERDVAAIKLAVYSEENNVAGSDKKFNEVLMKITVYDKMLSELNLLYKRSSIEYSVANEELGRQGVNLSDYNMDNGVFVDDFCAKIAEQQKKIVRLEYNCSGINNLILDAREQLDLMKNNLSQDVHNNVDEQCSSLSASQVSLVKKGVMAKINMKVANACELAVKSQMAVVEADTELLSFDVIEYLKLKRDADIKKETYTALIRLYEQIKLQAAMDNMDVQIMDHANLPNEKISLKRLCFVLGGAVAGIVISLIYIVGLYIKRKNQAITI